MKLKSVLIIIMMFMAGQYAFGQKVSTYAGVSGQTGFALDSLKTSKAKFYYPYDVAVDSKGDVYVTDWLNNSIRLITPNGYIHTRGGQGPNAAGYQDANVQTNALFNTPEGIAVGSDNSVYIADAGNNVIRKMTPYKGVIVYQAVSTIAGNPNASGYKDAQGTSAEFNHPMGIALDKNDNIYVTDFMNNVIRKIDKNGNVTTYAGTGTAGHQDGTLKTATFNRPSGIFITSNGMMYVTDVGTGSADGGNRIRQINMNTGKVTTVAGGYANYDVFGAINDPNTAKRPGFQFPYDILVADSGQMLVSEKQCMIKEIARDSVFQYAGTYGDAGDADGALLSAKFNNPVGLAWAPDGKSFYVADEGNQLIRKVDFFTVQNDTTDTTNDTTHTGLIHVENQYQIVAFPNPVQSSLHLNVENPTFKALTAKIIDMNGRVLVEKNISGQSAEIPMNDMNKGLYILTVQDHSGQVFCKLIMRD